MLVKLSATVFDIISRVFGREEALTFIKEMEEAISNATNYKWATTKEELLQAIRSEFITKSVFEERIENLRLEVLKEIEKSRTELLNKTEKDATELLSKIENTRVDLLGETATLQ
jgi:vacuolar-type H+-ATPase subunit H